MKEKYCWYGRKDRKNKGFLVCWVKERKSKKERRKIVYWIERRKNTFRKKGRTES